MPTLPIPINDGNYAFVTGQYFALSVVSTIDGSELDIGRAVFTECSPLEFTREVKELYESGHSEPYIGGDKRKYNNVTLKRGFSYDPATGVPHNHIEQWWLKGTKADLLIQIFDSDEGDGTQRQSKKDYRIKGAKPVRFKAWEGKADASDFTIQEIELMVEKIEPVAA